MAKLEKMTSERFAYYSGVSFENFLEEAAKSSGQDIEILRSKIGGPPSQPTDRDLWFVIEHEEQEAGFIWIQLSRTKSEAFLYDIYLKEEFRAKGLGRKVMLSCMDEAQRNGAEKFKLCVFQNNLVARKLYDSLGFKETDFNPERRQYSLELAIPVRVAQQV